MIELTLYLKQGYNKIAKSLAFETAAFRKLTLIYGRQCFFDNVNLLLISLVVRALDQ